MQIFADIPRERPSTPLLDGLASPEELRELEPQQLTALADELRGFLLWTLGRTGGHLGAGLGVVELSIVLHYVLDTPRDHLVWDVGHQSYPHKILTGRREQMHSLRQAHGLAGFPRRTESPYDSFGTGHSSTSVSAALGMALADPQHRAVAVIGDGAMTAGMAFEALNHAGARQADLLVVLNDNRMSISHNVGAISNYLSRLWSSPLYSGLRSGSKRVLSIVPRLRALVRRLEGMIKGFVSPGMLFEDMGFQYVGPVDGHDLPLLLRIISNLRDRPGPRLVHVITSKGKGYAPAERDPVGFHAIGKLEAADAGGGSKAQRYQDVFGDWLCDRAAADERLFAITPAMCEGSGMRRYAELYPERYADVGIAEQHALTLAAGLACEGSKPVVAIYSTFLQRAYDQLIHDIALQGLDVTFAIDRAGLVGEDGPTHNGAFDLSYLRCIPGMAVLAPADERELRLLLNSAYQHEGPAAVRYPRGSGPGEAPGDDAATVPWGRARQILTGDRVAILSFGALLHEVYRAAEDSGASLYDMRFVKPLDTLLIDRLAGEGMRLVSLEENALAGGAGAAVAEHISTAGHQVPLLRLGLPDAFVEQDTQAGMRAQCGLDAESLRATIGAWCEAHESSATVGHPEEMTR